MKLHILRPKICVPTLPEVLARKVARMTIAQLDRRGKYMVFHLARKSSAQPLILLGHLGMTGRMFMQDAQFPLPKHVTAYLELDRGCLVFQDPRVFGRLTLDSSPLEKLGPEPTAEMMSADYLHDALQKCRQSIKVKLLDQSFVAGIGNIYASEILHLARIHPEQPAHTLSRPKVERLREAIITVLIQAINFGSTLSLDWAGHNTGSALFYFGTDDAQPSSVREKLKVYDREGEPCATCHRPIQRLAQANRSTYYCQNCQPMVALKPIRNKS
jgi:formamidopyrimidine-DNA glycosylase